MRKREKSEKKQTSNQSSASAHYAARTRKKKEEAFGKGKRVAAKRVRLCVCVLERERELEGIKASAVQRRLKMAYNGYKDSVRGIASACVLFRIRDPVSMIRIVTHTRARRTPTVCVYLCSGQ